MVVQFRITVLYYLEARTRPRPLLHHAHEHHDQGHICRVGSPRDEIGQFTWMLAPAIDMLARDEVRQIIRVSPSPLPPLLAPLAAPSSRTRILTLGSSNTSTGSHPPSPLSSPSIQS